ncbi:MAG: hypothetical protein GDA53_01585 [Rhodobacteraceae bacterium]|nr:hypothetical protein [Paracoccaceae bacterium]
MAGLDSTRGDVIKRRREGTTCARGEAIPKGIMHGDPLAQKRHSRTG